MLRLCFLANLLKIDDTVAVLVGSQRWALRKPLAALRPRRSLYLVCHTGTGYSGDTCTSTFHSERIAGRSVPHTPFCTDKIFTVCCVLWASMQCPNDIYNDTVICALIFSETDVAAASIGCLQLHLPEALHACRMRGAHSLCHLLMCQCAG
jgi:hypothetical protein